MNTGNDQSIDWGVNMLFQHVNMIPDETATIEEFEAWQNGVREQINHAKGLGASIVRYPIDWRGLVSDNPAEEPYAYREIIEVLKLFEEAGMQVILEPGQTPSQFLPEGVDPLDPENFTHPPAPEHIPAMAQSLADFLEEVNKAEHGVAETVVGWEILNEPNSTYASSNLPYIEREGLFVQDARAATEYVALLNATYEAIKAVDDSAVVIISGPSFVDLDYLEILLKAEPLYDKIAVHPYNAADTTDPTSDNFGVLQRPTDMPIAGDPLTQAYSFYEGLRNFRDLMDKYGIEKDQIIITEFGGSSFDGWRGAGSEEKQALYIAEALGVLDSMELVDQAIAYQLYDQAASSDTEDITAESFFGLRNVSRDPVTGELVVGDNKLAGDVFSTYLNGTNTAPVVIGGVEAGVVIAGTSGNLNWNGNWTGPNAGFTGPQAVLGRGGNDRITGNIGDDALFGGFGNDRLNGGAGDDRLFGSAGNDRLNGGAGDDLLDGGSGKDRLNGGAGDDRMYGGAGNDRLIAGAGDDRLDGGTGNDIANGGAGLDVYVLKGDIRDFTITALNNGRYLITDTRPGPENQGMDTVFNVEQFEFTNQFNHTQLVSLADWLANPVDFQDPHIHLDDTETTQFITGDPNAIDSFVISGLSTDYGWDRTLDGQGIVIWNDERHDILFDVEEIIFDDGRVEQAQDGSFNFIPNAINGAPDGDLIHKILDIADDDQYINGTNGTDQFVIDGSAGDYGWGETNDGRGIVVWRGQSFDILFDVEQIRFNDGLVVQNEDKSFTFIPDEKVNGVYIIEDDPNENQHTYGTQGPDVFRVSGASTDYGWGETDDSEGIVLWNDANFDILFDVEQIQFADGTLTQLANDTFIFASNEELIRNGTNGRNTLDGTDGNDTLNGLRGRDVLNGNDGNDVLNGGRGSDVLTGGTGLDRFIAEERNGNDVITDFEDGYDLIDFRQTDRVTDFSDIEGNIRQVGANTVVTFDGGQFTLQDFNADSLTFNDFIFT